MSKGMLTYETKCLRCGELHDWFFMQTDGNHTDAKRFFDVMQSKIQAPGLTPCTKCEKETVHAVVAYDNPFKMMRDE